MDEFLISLNVSYIKKRAKRLKVNNYYKLNKKENIKQIYIITNARKIQRWVRKKLAINTHCCISLDKINYPCWGTRAENSKFFYYNLKPLVEYMIKSGNFKDPNTRKSFTSDELKYMDLISKKYNIKNKGLFKYSNKYSYYKRKRELDDRIVIITDIVREKILKVQEFIDDWLYNTSNIINVPIEILIFRIERSILCSIRLNLSRLKDISIDDFIHTIVSCKNIVQKLNTYENKEMEYIKNIIINLIENIEDESFETNKSETEEE